MGALLNVTLNYSSIALENSDAVKSAKCTGDELWITFWQQNAYNYAKSTWPKSGTKFILATYFPGCAGHNAGRRSFSLVNSYQMDDSTLAIRAVVEDTDLKSIMQNFNLQWGTATAQNRTLSKRVSIGSHTVSINVAPAANSLVTTSAFGSTFPIYSNNYISAYCVTCAARGSLTLSGQINWSILHPTTLQSGSAIVINGNLDIRALIGITGQASYSNHALTKTLFSSGLPGFSIPGIINLGPQITATANLDVDVNAAGQLLAGFELAWPNAQTTIDLVAATQSNSGWTPSFSPTLRATGTFGITLTPSIPVSLGFGISVLGGAWSKTLALVETPSLTLSAAAYGAVGIGSKKMEDVKEGGAQIKAIEAPAAESVTIVRAYVLTTMVINETSTTFVTATVYATPATGGPPVESSTTSTSLLATAAPPVPASTTLVTTTSPVVVSPPASTSAAYCHPGINFSMAFQNVVSMNAFGVRTYVLNSYTSLTLSRCVASL